MRGAGRSRSQKSQPRRRSIIGNLIHGWEGSQLLEFALVAPFLLVFVVAILDFGQVYNLKQELNNAAREGARFAAGENSGAGLTTSDVDAVRDVVDNYLTGANVTECAIGASPSVSGFVYTFSSSSTGCSSFSLVINRASAFTVGTTTVIGTKVTLTYPYAWSLGKMMGFILRGSTLALPATIQTDCTMQNLN